MKGIIMYWFFRNRNCSNTKLYCFKRLCEAMKFKFCFKGLSHTILPARILVEKGKIGARQSTYGGERGRRRERANWIVCDTRWLMRSGRSIHTPKWLRQARTGRAKRTHTHQPSITYWGFDTYKCVIQARYWQTTMPLIQILYHFTRIFPYKC